MSELYLTINWNEVYCVKGMAMKTNQKRCRRWRLSERDVSGMGCPSLWEHGMDALMPVPESSWQNLADRRHHQEVRETPVDLSVGLSRDIQTSWMCVYLCVCVGWRPAAEWSWDVKDDTCVSAGEGVCCHCQWGWDWSTSLLALISVSIPPFLLFLIRGSCSEPRLILGQWVAGLWGTFWGSFWNVLCHSITTREQWRKWTLWLNTLATSFLSVNI